METAGTPLLRLSFSGVKSENLGLTTANQPEAMQRPLTGEAAITSAAEWSACYITTQA